MDSLSGGQKTRVALGKLLLTKPDIILLDEPTSMLDPRSCRELAEYLRTLPALILIATHDLAFARRICPEALILRNGKLAAGGKTEELLEQHELLVECGLE